MIRTLYIIVLTLLFWSGCFAQNSSDGRIAFYSVVNNQSGIVPQSAVDILENKMNSLVASDGYGSSSRADRFVIIAKPTVVSKDIAPTTPPRISQTIEITFVAGDVVENKTYSSCVLTLNGIGVNETKAWTSALSVIKSTNGEFRNMLVDAGDKIKAFYSANCHAIIESAETEAAMGNYEKAISTLLEIPDICAECFTDARKKAMEIYQSRIDAEGVSLLAKARSEWSASPDSEGARTAMAYLKQIDPSSSSFTARENLETEIVSKLTEDGRRKWKEEQKRYKDELKLRQKKMNYSQQQEMATIEACRSVAEKWAENQQPTNVYLNW